MRILHVWDQAGVACIFAKYQIRNGHQSKVIRIEGDRYGIYQFYKNYVTNVQKDEFVDRCLHEARAADIIHIHGPINILFALRRKFGRSKTIILHYLGTDIRGLNPSEKRTTYNQPSILSIIIDVIFRKIQGKALPKDYIHILAQKLADVVLVATPDLIQYIDKAVYLPIPVDTEHFIPDAVPDQKKCALTFNTEVTDISRAIDYCNKNDIHLDIEVYDRTRNPIMYAEMPNFLKRYQVYVDIRFIKQTILKNLSSTALQSLASGLRVLDHQLKYHDRFPVEHDAVTLTRQLLRLYAVKRKGYSSYLWHLVFRASRR
jgi:glycosyltransferase involved in cell wall biosynthesis